ncbi:MAG TPA: hypothetical protein PLP58_20185 [Prosthecobacter sp.]|nr:hypothetical protein [Prosthecobacter sp.]
MSVRRAGTGVHFAPATRPALMRRPRHTSSFPPPGRSHVRHAPGYTMIEMMFVVIVITLVVALTAGVTDSLKSNRGTTAMQQLVSVMDSGRAKALAGQQEIWIAFANGEARAPAQAFRSYAVCYSIEDDNLPEGQRSILLPLTGWEHLPTGFVFTLTAPALQSAGQNLMSHPAAAKRVRFSASNPAGMGNLPCIRFGTLGEVEQPESGGTLLLAVAEGEVRGSIPVKMSGGGHDPAYCRWLSVQRNTGKAVLLP